MKRVCMLALAAVLLFSALGFAGCMGKADEKVLKVGFDAGFPPMGFEKDGKYVGFDLDLAKEVASRIGYKYEEHPITWKNKDADMKSGTINCIWNGFTVNEKRRLSYEFTDAYMTNAQVVMVLADSSYTKLADLAGKKVGIQESSTAVEAIDANPDLKSIITLDLVDDNEKARLNLDAGAVDAVAMDKVVAEYKMKLHEGKYRILGEQLMEEYYAVGFAKGDTALCALVQEALNAMVKDGTFKKISEAWFGTDVSIKAE